MKGSPLPSEAGIIQPSNEVFSSSSAVRSMPVRPKNRIKTFGRVKELSMSASRDNSPGFQLGTPQSQPIPVGSRALMATPENLFGAGRQVTQEFVGSPEQFAGQHFDGPGHVPQTPRPMEGGPVVGFSPLQKQFLKLKPFEHPNTK